jgi:hypothetical protein
VLQVLHQKKTMSWSSYVYTPLASQLPDPVSKPRRRLSAPRGFCFCVFFLAAILFAFNAALDYGLMLLFSDQGFQLDLSLAAFTTTCDRKEGNDEYCIPTIRSVCAGLPNSPSDPETYFPVVEGFGNLCAAFNDLETNFRTFTVPLPEEMLSSGSISDNYNRGHLVPDYLLQWFANGPFSGAKPEDASAVIMPLKLEPQHNIADSLFCLAINLLAPAPREGGNRKVWFILHRALMMHRAFTYEMEHYPEVLARYDGLDHVVFATAVEYIRADMRHKVVGVVSDSDVGEDRFDTSKDVATVSTISFWLPMYAQQGFNSKTHAKRNMLYFFAGGDTDKMRKTLERAHLESGRKDGLVWVGAHLTADDYVQYQFSSKFCFHVRGSRGWSPRVIEVRRNIILI